MSEIASIRQAILKALPITSSNYGEIPDSNKVYVPPSHLKALRLECNLVIGSRGVGKSFWAAALRSPKIRESLGHSVSELSQANVFAGFGVLPDIDSYPDGDSFSSLLNSATPYDVWRAVVTRRLSHILQVVVPTESWKATVDWVTSEPESFARLLQNANKHYADLNQMSLIVFDALDRTSSDWGIMDTIVRDLLRVILLLKSYPRLHGKVFLREDQFGRSITNFADASKLLATRVDLNWASHDLHGLLWQMFCNAPADAGECLRSVYQRVTGNLQSSKNGTFHLSEEIKRTSDAQRSLFEALAGQWMGKDKRRGVPYVWSVSHLADGQGRISPRSFLAAIYAASEDSQLRYQEYAYALHYESIKRGVQKASEIRVSEITEDYPWVTNLLEPLRGLTVPCNFDFIKDRWAQKFGSGPLKINSDRLPPQHLNEGWDGVRSDLERLGIFEMMRDGRVNMPDLYRVGFGLGRRGGVKPVIRSSGGES